MPPSHNLPEPNLVILGAQKSGTTSLYHYLKVHPDIFMASPVKEPGYYLGDDRAKIFWERMGQPIESREQLLRERMLQGYQGERWFGDASTYYTIGMRSQKFNIPKRMASAHADMKLIYIMRDPVERVLSNYRHLQTRGTYEGSFEAFLQTHEGKAAVRTSCYHFQLTQYLKYFPKEQFLVLQFEALTKEPQAEMQRICHFLDICAPNSAATYKAHNESAEYTHKTGLISEEDEIRVRRMLGSDMRQLFATWQLRRDLWRKSLATR
nr:sulfotransferase [Oceanococcus sp. HetDA_MAG_MS8]